MKILFVCTGNTCRSPMAESLLLDYLKKTNQTDKVEVQSAGIHTVSGLERTIETKKVLEKFGLPCRGVSREMTLDMLTSFDVIVTMTEAQKEALLLVTEAENKIHTLRSYQQKAGGTEHLNIIDPFGKDELAYLKTFLEIKEALTALIAHYRLDV